MLTLNFDTTTEQELNALAQLEEKSIEQLLLDAVQMYRDFIAKTTQLPNEKTIAAIEEARNKHVERYDSLSAMWADLDSD
jgi:hypothetical protein